jgi:hypothetical protein
MKLKQLGILLLGIGIAMVYVFINPSEVDFLPKCPLFSITGIYCPGCGSQRATHQLLNFNFFGVLNQNILYAAGLLLFLYHGIILTLNKFFGKNRYNYIYHPKTPIVILFFIILFWILRNIPIYPFNLLAPK